MSWKHLVLDLFTVLFLVMVALAWEDRQPNKRVMDIVLCAGLVIFRINAHWRFYKKEKRFY